MINKLKKYLDFIKTNIFKKQKMETYQDYEHPKANDMSYLYDWVLHFNPYTQLWAAVPREIYNQYWDDYDLPGVIRSSKIETLLELLHKSKGDIDLLNEIVKP